MKWTGGPTDFKKIFIYISWSKMHQIGQPRTVLKSLESEEFKTVLSCPIWCIFDQDLYLKIFLKSVGPPVHFIFSLYCNRYYNIMAFKIFYTSQPREKNKILSIKKLDLFLTNFVYSVCWWISWNLLNLMWEKIVNAIHHLHL